MTGPATEPVADLLTAAEALALLAASTDTVSPRGPLLAVRLDGATSEQLDALGAATDSLAGVVVGVASGDEEPTNGAGVPPNLDVLLTDRPDASPPWHTSAEGTAAALARLAAGVAAAPQAAVTLVQVLRLGEGRSLDDALVAESLAYAMLQAGPAFGAWLASRPPPARPGGGLGAGGRPPVTLARDGDLLRITLDRPEVRNALDVTMRDALVEAFDLAARDPAIARVELRGNGPDFCSGGDLREFGTVEDPPAGHLVRSARLPVRALAGCADRVTARVHGASVGAGIEVAALARHVVAAPGATFRLPEVAMGLVPGAGGTATIPRRIGRQLTAWMALTGATVDALTALRWGLVDALDGGPADT